MFRCFLWVSFLMFSFNISAQLETTKIIVGNGPEDLVVDTFLGSERLIVACSARRNSELPFNEIMSIDLKTNEITKMHRVQPSSICFHPHGLDLVFAKNDKTLFIVNHCNEKDIHQILQYSIVGDSLFFISATNHNLIVSPNAVCGFADGSFIVSNDAGKHGAIFEKLFIQKKSKLVFCNVDSCVEIGERVCFGNGVTMTDSFLYHASTMPGAVYKYERNGNSFSNRVLLSKVKGADNIRLYGEYIIVAGHPKFGKFISHMKNAKKHSPSEVWIINRFTGESTIVFRSDGSLISAASGAVIYKNYLFIAQVFDNFVLKVRLD